MIADVVSVRPEQSIGEALKLLDRHGIRALPVVTAEGRLVGHVDFAVVLSNLLPGPLMVDPHGERFSLRLDYFVGEKTEVDVAKRLRELLPLKVSEVMDSEPKTVHRDTPLWEGIRLLVQHGSPIGVVEEGSGKFLGLVSLQSAIRVLMQMVGDMR
jgi:CBS domain-containing protein